MKLTIDQSLLNGETEIIIRCGLIDEQLEKLIEQIRLYSFSITGMKDGVKRIIRLEDIFYFESIDEKCFLYCEKEVYECERKLYELEDLLEGTSFVRISKACIVNTARLDSVRPHLNGRIEARLENGERLIVNRHYVAEFKARFGL